MPGGRRPPLELLAQLLVRLAHVGVAHVHLAVEVVRQAAVVVEAGEVGAADVADLQLLVARGPRGVGEGLELALTHLLLVLGGADLVQLVEGERDAAHLAEDGDLEEACVDGLGEVGDLLELWDRWFSHCLTTLAGTHGRKRTRLFVCRISSGVFSSRRCAASIRRSHSSMYFCMSRR